MTNTEILPARKPDLVAGNAVAPIVPRTIEEVARVANAVIVAGLAPESYKQGGAQETASRIMIGIMSGAELGLAPMQSLKAIAIINGKAALYGDGAVSLVQASGKVEKWEENWTGEEPTPEWTATCRIWRKGQSEPYVGKFTWAEAVRARLVTKGPWRDYPNIMLMWRARTKAMRLGFADFLSGLGIVEELQDIPPPPKPVATDFLSDTPEPQQIATSGPEMTVEQVSAMAEAPEAKTDVETPLTRGWRLLMHCKTIEDVADLKSSIAEELQESEFPAWEAMCKERRGEIVK
jgi:hypothetical protein